MPVRLVDKNYGLVYAKTEVIYMKKTTSRSKVDNIKKKSLVLKKKSKLKGLLGEGTLYVVVGILIVALGAVSMVGNIVPLTNKSQSSGQPAITLPPNLESQKENLQLFTFPGVTYTPTPYPTAYPGAGSNWKNGNKNDKRGGGSCFIAGTKILMADMIEKNIEDVKAGDRIMSFDGKGTSTQEVYKIESPVRNHHYIVKFSDGSTIGITNDHAVLTDDGWQAIDPNEARYESPDLEVSELATGDKVLNKDGKYIQIVSMDYIPGDIQTYNLKDVSQFNNYYANGFVAHNKSSGGGGGGGGGGGTAM